MLATLEGLISAQSYPVLTLVGGTMLLAGFVRGFVGFGASPTGHELHASDA